MVHDLSVAIDVCPLCSMSCVTCWIFEVGCLFWWSICAVGSKGYWLSTVPPPKIAVMHWSEPKSYNELVCLSHSLILALGANDLDIGTPFAKAGCLQWLSGLVVSHSMCMSWFLWVLQLCLHICVLPLHHHPQWHVMKGLGNKVWPRGDRPDSESFKARHTYTYSKIILRLSIWGMGLHHHPWLWMSKLVHLCQSYVCIAAWLGTTGTFASACRWGEVQLLLKCCHILV